MLKQIKPLYFFVSFAIGIFLVYIFHPPPDVVMKFPSPYNAGKVTYKDSHDSCYQYKADMVECPVDRNNVRPQPLFENFTFMDPYASKDVM